MRRRQRKKVKIAVLISLIALAGYLYLSSTGQNIQNKIEEAVNPQPIPFQEITIEEKELGQKYYYQFLDNKERQVYKEIAQGVRNNEKEIYVHSEDAKRTNTLFQYVLQDFPEIFWCDGTTTATSYEGKDAYTVLKPVYLYEKEQKEVMKIEIADSVNEWLKEISKDSTDYEKILFVYETIVNKVDYDLEAKDNQNIYSVFVNKRSVCAGYSKAAQYLLERLGVFCTYVTGTTAGNQSHAWNLVKCNEEYYYVDTTWGDPVFQQEEGEEKHKNISYDYMCCDEEELLKTHTPDPDIPLPECTAMKDNYYVVNDMYYESYDSQKILKKMNETISSKGDSIVLKFADENIYREAHDDVFQNVIKRAVKNLARWYGLEEVKYQYVDDAKLNKIIIYWQYE